MFIENSNTPAGQPNYEERARYERSAVFHTGLARLVRIFHPKSTRP